MLCIIGLFQEFRGRTCTDLRKGQSLKSSSKKDFSSMVNNSKQKVNRYDLAYFKVITLAVSDSLGPNLWHGFTLNCALEINRVQCAADGCHSLLTISAWLIQHTSIIDSSLKRSGICLLNPARYLRLDSFESVISMIFANNCSCQ